MDEAAEGGFQIGNLKFEMKRGRGEVRVAQGANRGTMYRAPTGPERSGGRHSTGSGRAWTVQRNGRAVACPYGKKAEECGEKRNGEEDKEE